MADTDGPLATHTGRVVERALGGESKQARTVPVLGTEDGDILIYVIGDNPFAPSQLAAWLGLAVEVTGRWRGNALRVAPADIRALPDVPAGPNTDEPTTAPARQIEPADKTEGP